MSKEIEKVIRDFPIIQKIIKGYKQDQVEGIPLKTGKGRKHDPEI